MSLGTVENCDRCGNLFVSKNGITTCRTCLRKIIREELKKDSAKISDQKGVDNEKSAVL